MDLLDPILVKLLQLFIILKPVLLPVVQFYALEHQRPVGYEKAAFQFQGANLRQVKECILHLFQCRFGAVKPDFFFVFLLKLNY